MSSDAQTVTVRVQVVDMQPFLLDLQVPTYLPARDLTQRIARDAGLDAYWEDGRRRLYWIRARGRLLGDGETLLELGVINGELIYLLPEPPAGEGVVERPPDYPVNIGYPAKGLVILLSALGFTVAWTIGWAVALSELMNDWTVAVPGLALGLITTAFSRHAWGGRANRPRVVLTSLAVLVPCVVLAFTLANRIAGGTTQDIYAQAVAGLVFGLVGVMVGWLAWWGAVDPLPKRTEEETAVEDAVAVVDCGLCGQNVLPDVRAECPYACGRFFHSGCYRARVAVYTGDPRKCAICSVELG
jgi:uncharacterized ubiquitin-like protein YukD